LTLRRGRVRLVIVQTSAKPKMSLTAIHHGAPSAITPSGSPGLLFLKSFFPLLDSLEPADALKLKNDVLPTAQFIINGTSIGTTEQVIPMLSMRAQKLARFKHEVDIIWDILPAHDQKKRTVMYESTSVTVFKEDKEEVKVREFNIIELEDQGEGSWKAMELRTFMDTSPVRDKGKKIAEAAK
jgi:hypothetical protein